MKNKVVKLILGIAVLGVLLGGYFGVKGFVANQEAEEATETEETEYVFETDQDSITSLKFMIDKKEVIFTKQEDGSWIKEDEPEFPVDQDALSSAAASISSLEADRVLEEVNNISEYGLDIPDNTITVTDSEENSTVLKIGIQNSSTSQYYVEKDGDDSTVYVVSSTLVSPFMKTLYDYAEMELFPSIDAYSVKSVSVDQGDSSYSAEKDENENWQLSFDRETGNADSAKMSSITSALNTMEFEQFVDYHCEDPEKYGFTNPYAVVTVNYEEMVETDTEDQDVSETETTEETEEEAVESETTDESVETDSEEPTTVQVDKTLLITIGNTAENDTRYVMLDNDNQVYTITNDLLSTLIDKDPDSMWDMTINYLPMNQLEHLDVSYNEEEKTVNVSRETISKSSENQDADDEESTDADSVEDTSSSEVETEEVTTYLMDGKEINYSLFSTFYNKLINMTGQSRLKEEYHPENEPEMTVVFHDLNGAGSEVSFYEYDVNYYAVSANEKVYLVNKMTFKELKGAYEDFLDSPFAEDEE